MSRDGGPERNIFWTSLVPKPEAEAFGLAYSNLS